MVLRRFRIGILAVPFSCILLTACAWIGFGDDDGPVAIGAI